MQLPGVMPAYFRAVKNAVEVKIFVDKILKYEKDAPEDYLLNELMLSVLIKFKVLMMPLKAHNS